MSSLKPIRVDERDSTWESNEPRFRIYFFHGEFTEPPRGLATDVYDIVGGDILQVIDWAQRRAGSELMYAVAMVEDRFRPAGKSSTDTERGLVWILGMDANEFAEPATAEIRRRMAARRTRPVIIPHLD